MSNVNENVIVITGASSGTGEASDRSLTSRRTQAMYRRKAITRTITVLSCTLVGFLPFVATAQSQQEN